MTRVIFKARFAALHKGPFVKHAKALGSSNPGRPTWPKTNPYKCAVAASYWRSHSVILTATLTPIGCAERQRIVLPLDELRRESQESQSGLKLVQGIIRAGDLKRRQESRQIANRGQI